MKVLFVLLFCIYSVFSLQAGPGRGKGCGLSCAADITAAPGSLVISPAEWTRLWMDEIVAHDLYAALDETTRKPIFQNIGASEKRHREMIEALLTSAGIALPEAPEAGKYSDPELQALYTEQLESGKTSEQAAFAAGEAFEKQDIAELEAALKTGGLSEAEKTLLTALRDASLRHLAAFPRQLAD